MFSFQSKDRNVDLGDPVRRVQFSNYEFSTENDETAAFVRRNCKANPNLYWETTQEVLQKQIKDVPVETPVEIPKQRGRFKKKGLEIVTGMRSSEIQEGERST